MPKYAYGWRPSAPDHRDFFFAAKHAVMANLPAKVDLSTPSLASPFEPAWDQGKLGTCGPHSAAENLVFDMLRYNFPLVMPSRLFIYYYTRKLMGTLQSDSGVDNRTMLKALAQYGWCDEALCPYSDDPQTFLQQPSGVAQAAALQNKISQYLAVPQDLSQLKACLASGYPFILGFTVYESFESVATAQTGDTPIPKQQEAVLGGHDVLCVGFDDATLRFKFKNHWTPQWGKNGYGTLPYSYVTSPRLAGDFWTIKSPGSAPTPVPPSPPISKTRTIVITGASQITVDGKVI